MQKDGGPYVRRLFFFVFINIRAEYVPYKG